MCKAPGAVVGSLMMAMTVSGTAGSTTNVFTFDAAAGSSIAADTNIPVGWVVSMTVIGGYMGTAYYSVERSISRTACKATNWESTTTVACAATAGIGSSSSIGITAGVQTASVSNMLSYDGPIAIPSSITISVTGAALCAA